MIEDITTGLAALAIIWIVGALMMWPPYPGDEQDGGAAMTTMPNEDGHEKPNNR